VSIGGFSIGALVGVGGFLGCKNIRAEKFLGVLAGDAVKNLLTAKGAKGAKI